MKKILCALLLACLVSPVFAAEKESAYDRIMRTQTIRCGYGTNPPWIYRDLTTGEMKGPNVEIMQEIAKQLGFKLEWPEETGWANLPTSLAAGRVDVACSLLWTDPVRGKLVAYPKPLFYSAIHLYARADDKRFTGKAEEINRPDIRIAVQDGDINEALARRYFPEARLVSLPQASSWTEVYMNVTTGKADVTFADSISVDNFNKAQEKKMRRIALPQPITVYGTAPAVGIQETALKEMLDTTITYLLDTGRIDEILKDFVRQYPDALVPAAKSYGALR